MLGVCHLNQQRWHQSGRQNKTKRNICPAVDTSRTELVRTQAQLISLPAKNWQMVYIITTLQKYSTCVHYDTHSSPLTDSLWHVFSRCLAWTSHGILVKKTEIFNGFTRCVQVAVILALDICLAHSFQATECDHHII